MLATCPVAVANRCSPYLNLKSQSGAVVGSSIHQGKYTTSPNTFNSAFTRNKLRILDYFPPIFSWQKCSRSNKFQIFYNFKISRNHSSCDLIVTTSGVFLKYDPIDIIISVGWIYFMVAWHDFPWFSLVENSWPMRTRNLSKCSQ